LNQTIIDYLFSFLYFPKYYVKLIIRYRRTFKNFSHVFLKVYRNEFPIKGILKNGESVRIQSRFDSGAITCNFKDYFNWNKQIVNITNPNLPTVKLLGAEKNGDIQTVFFNEEYKVLDIKDKIVVDVGANIGDSAIYFALKGAKKVIALEPFPENYKLAKKNIELNNLTDKIILLHAGCASKSGKIKINPKSTGPCSILSEDVNGLEIPLLSLEDIVKDYKINSGILKMDCEGCEVDVILNSSKNTFQKFSQLFIEYHYGYKDIIKKLNEVGFSSDVTRPIWNPLFTAQMQLGNIISKYKEK